MTARAIGWGKVVEIRPYEGYCGISVEIDQSAAPVGIKGCAIFAVDDSIEYLPELDDDVCIAVPEDKDSPIQVHRSAGEWSRPEVTE